MPGWFWGYFGVDGKFPVCFGASEGRVSRTLAQTLRSRQLFPAGSASPTRRIGTCSGTGVVLYQLQPRRPTNQAPRTESQSEMSDSTQTTVPCQAPPLRPLSRRCRLIFNRTAGGQPPSAGIRLLLMENPPPPGGSGWVGSIFLRRCSRFPRASICGQEWGFGLSSSLASTPEPRTPSRRRGRA